MNEFIGCRLCHKTKGYIYSQDELGNDIVEKCKCLEDYQYNSQINYYLQKANIHEDIKNYNLDKYVGIDKNKNIDKIKKFIDNFDSKFYNVNLYFYGVQGTQKSTLSRYIAYELLKKKKSCYYILADVLLKDLLTKLDKKENLEAQIDNILNCDLLIIDEISDDKVTIYQSDYQIPFLTSFLKLRLEKIKKSTIFISNYTIEDLYKSKFGMTISDLINRECQGKMLFEDNYYKIINKKEIEENLWK